MRDIEAAPMAEFHPFELLPEALIWVQLRSIGGQTLQVETLGGPIGQTLLDGVTAVDRGTIPDDDHAAGHCTQERLPEGDHICRVERAVLALEVELARRRDGIDGREMIAGAPCPQDGCLAHRRIGTHDTREGINPGLV
jgi:hypothetical protein